MFEQVFESSEELGLTFDVQGGLLRANASARRFAGTLEHLRARADLMAPFGIGPTRRDGAVFADLVKQQHLPTEHECDWINQSGQIRRIRWHHQVVCDGQGEPVAVVCLGRDVTDRQAEMRTLRHRRDFTAFQGRVNRTLMHASDEGSLFDDIAQLAVEQAGANLAWFGRPDDRLRFRVLASAGAAATAYLDGIVVSADPSAAEGRGPWGRTWNEGNVLFIRSLADSPAFSPWAARAAACGLESCATLPIRRGGRMWAVFCVYLPETLWVDPELRTVLEALATDLSHKLDVLDARQLNLALTHYTDAAISVATHRRLDFVNPKLVELFGADSAQKMEGQPTRVLYADEANYQRVGASYAEIERHGVVRLQDVACRSRDGSLLWCDMVGTRLGGESTVWTLIDVTTRVSQQRQIVRLSRYNALLAQVNHVIAHERDEHRLLQSICDLAVRHAKVSLAWIGRPDDSGRFVFLAASGPAIAYLDGMELSSDATIPQGQGGAGRAFRSGRAWFYSDLGKDPWIDPWVERVTRHGLKSAGVLPIRRQGRVWAILTLYGTEAGIFDERLRAVLKELSHHISGGLDGLDLARRERETSDLNALLLDALSVAVIVVRYPDRIIEQANAQLLQMAAAASFDELVGRGAHDFYPDEATYQRISKLAQQVLSQGRAGLSDVPYRSLDGRELWADVFGHRLDKGDDVQRIIWTHVDVTERHRTETRLKALGDMRQTLLSNTVVGITLVRYPERVIVEANRGALDMMGYGEDPQALIGRSAQTIYDLVSEDERVARLVRKILARGSGSVSELQVRRRDGGHVYVDMHGRRLEGSDPAHPIIVWTAVDVTERRELTQALDHQALFDALTDLPNRRALEQRLALAIARARHQGTRVAVGMLDLDDFKPVNDAFGDAAGNALLKAFGGRVESVLREAEFIARVGGDEFVAVLEGIDADVAGEALADAWSHLHRAVETPFPLEDGHEARIGMSMGVALYPDDADEPDALLRQADAAMYQAKARKRDRAQWWRLHRPLAESEEGETDPFDPFGPRARSLLADIAVHLASTADGFAHEFYDSLALRAESADILSVLSAEEFVALKQNQAAHLQFLMAPQTTAQDIEDRARALGQIHALCGVTPNWIAEGMTLYGQLLRTNVERLVTTPRRRYRIVRTADTRTGLDMQVQLSAMQTLMDDYHAHTARALPEAETWASVAQEELEALSALPGILACQVMRPGDDGHFTIEMSAGRISQDLVRRIEGEALHPDMDVHHATGRGLVSTAWRTGRVQRSDALQHDQRTRAWGWLYTDLGVRSLMVLPVQGDAGVAFVLVVEGAYLNQFSSGWMQSFSASLAQRWGLLVTPETRRSAPLEQTRALRYRALLRGGGLRMYVQPAVRLDTGAPAKVEALARLITPEGEVLTPAQFMPALRDADFHLLFRQGLDQSLGYLRQWEEGGLKLGVSLNIAPSTLAQPACAAWVVQALERHGVASRRLTLEVLETQDFDERQHDAAIDRLRRTGVRLAIDDLGSGYSSLKRLARLPVNVIKIDQALVRDISTEPIKTLSLLNTITTIGNDLGRRIVVEGVEDEATLDAISVLGAHYVQGYAIAHPMPADDLPGWSERWRTTWAPSPGLRSFLGALAYHWRSLHQPDSSCLRNYEACPLTAFLLRCDRAGAQAARWHRRIHDPIEARQRRATQHRLTRWLVQQIRSDTKSELTMKPETGQAAHWR